MLTTLLLLALTQTPQPAAPPAPAPGGQTAAPARPARPRAATPATTTVFVFVTDKAGAPLGDATVSLMGPIDREGKTAADGTLRLPGLRAGTYRVRFERDGFHTFEKELTWRAGSPAPEVSATLNPAPPPPPPPPPPPAPPPVPEASAATTKLPPPGEMKTLSLLDLIERNFIGSKEPHKENIVSCSGVGQTILWQVRDPWEGRQHAGADAMLYVIGGEGSLKLAASDIPLAAGSFAVVPRGVSYGFARRGRNPLIILAVLAGAPCVAE